MDSTMTKAKSAASSRAIRPSEADAAPTPLRLGRLQQAIGFNLRMAQESAFRAFAHRVGDPDLKPRRYAILTIIRENPGLTQAELGRASGREKSSITPALQDLIRRGMVKRRSSRRDKRVYTLWLTNKGSALLDRLAAHAAEHNRMLEQCIGAENVDSFLHYLVKVTLGCTRYSLERDGDATAFRRPRT